jgi:ActR/RegA family two-component response regulator
MLEHRVFVVDDDPSWQDVFREGIEDLNYTEIKGKRKGRERYTAQVASSYEEADAKLDRQHFHLALVDLRLQGGAEELKGMKLVRKIAELDEGTSTIIVSGYADATIATEALKKWKAFYLIEKEKLDAKHLTELVQGAVSLAEERYRTRFASAIDFLRRNQDINSWVAEILRAILQAVSKKRTSELRDFFHLRDLLNELLADLYPLLYHRLDEGVIIDSDVGVVSCRCWSKALGKPILVKFGMWELANREVKDVDKAAEMLVQGGFVSRERVHRVADLGGIVYVLADIPFEDFERRMS